MRHAHPNLSHSQKNVLAGVNLGGAVEVFGGAQTDLESPLGREAILEQSQWGGFSAADGSGSDVYGASDDEIAGVTPPTPATPTVDMTTIFPPEKQHAGQPDLARSKTHGPIPGPKPAPMMMPILPGNASKPKKPPPAKPPAKPPAMPPRLPSRPSVDTSVHKERVT